MRLLHAYIYELIRKDKMKLKFVTLLAVLLHLPALSHASLMGVPTDVSGTTPLVGSPYFDASTGKIMYYIPIKNEKETDGSYVIPDGQYGVDDYPGVTGPNDPNDYGLVADYGYATATNPLGGPALNMTLFFDVEEGKTYDVLTLWFDDLDLKHLNTPNGFFETISIRGIEFDEWSDFSAFPNVSIVDNTVPLNNSDVSITISGLNFTEDFWLDLEFTSYSEGLYGWYKNTPEYLSAHLSVPEPAIIALFGLGLVGLGFARRKA